MSTTPPPSNSMIQPLGVAFFTGVLAAFVFDKVFSRVRERYANWDYGTYWYNE